MCTEAMKGETGSMSTDTFKKIGAVLIAIIAVFAVVIFITTDRVLPFVLFLLACVALAVFLFLLPDGLLSEVIFTQRLLIGRMLCVFFALSALLAAGLLYQPQTNTEGGGVFASAARRTQDVAKHDVTPTPKAIMQTAVPRTAAPTAAPTATAEPTLEAPVEIVYSAAVMEAYNTGKDLYDEGRYEEAYVLLLKAAKAGHSNAQLYAGKSLQEEIKVDDDAKPAAYWYALSAVQNNDAAQYELGRCYFSGDGVERNFDKAFQWFSEAAERDNANGLLWVGYCYHHGISVAQNYDLALQYYQAAKDRGHTYAQHRIDELMADWNK